jgi:hypothetical protein
MGESYTGSDNQLDAAVKELLGSLASGSRAAQGRGAP